MRLMDEEDLLEIMNAMRTVRDVIQRNCDHIYEDSITLPSGTVKIRICNLCDRERREKIN
jgi:hypothetical protein